MAATAGRDEPSGRHERRGKLAIFAEDRAGAVLRSIFVAVVIYLCSCCAAGTSAGSDRAARRPGRPLDDGGRSGSGEGKPMNGRAPTTNDCWNTTTTASRSTTIRCRNGGSYCSGSPSSSAPLYILYYHFGDGVADGRGLQPGYDRLLRPAGSAVPGDGTRSREATLVDLMDETSMMAGGAQALFQGKCCAVPRERRRGQHRPQPDRRLLAARRQSDRHLLRPSTEGVPSKGMLAWKNQAGPKRRDRALGLRPTSARCVEAATRQPQVSRRAIRCIYDPSDALAEAPPRTLPTNPRSGDAPTDGWRGDDRLGR